jgi:putative transposase
MLRRHRRIAFENSIHFITIVTRERGFWFRDDACCRGVLESFEHHRRRLDLVCHAYVLMPDHLHALLLQESEGELIPDLVREFKKWTSRRCSPADYSGQSLWQDEYDDVGVPGSEAARTKIEYIHDNPVRKGMLERPEQYLWSSAREYWEIGKGIVEITKPW